MAMSIIGDSAGTLEKCFKRDRDNGFILPRIDVAEVSEDLTCLSHGYAKYTPAVVKNYSKTNENDLEKWYFDVGTMNIPKTCPSQINETGHFKFRARAFYESYPQVKSKSGSHQCF